MEYIRNERTAKRAHILYLHFGWHCVTQIRILRLKNYYITKIRFPVHLITWMALWNSIPTFSISDCHCYLLQCLLMPIYATVVLTHIKLNAHLSQNICMHSVHRMAVFIFWHDETSMILHRVYESHLFGWFKFHSFLFFSISNFGSEKTKHNTALTQAVRRRKKNLFKSWSPSKLIMNHHFKCENCYRDR